MDYKIVGFTLGLLLVILGVAELVPAALEWALSSAEASNFFMNSIICLFFGTCLILINKSFERKINIRQAFMLTSISWLFISAFAALPFYMSNLNLSYTDSFFEAMSGITTTGSTVLTRLDSMSSGILLWRSITQWIGGIGLVAFAIILLPTLRVGGMQLFQTESSDKSEKLIPRSADIMKHLLVIYIGFTVLCALSYYLEGMSLFNAINHAMTTIPTGGFSTHDASFGYYESTSMQLTAAIFMFLCGIPFILYIKLFYQNNFGFLKDEQTIIYTAIVVVLTIIMTIWIWVNEDQNLTKSFTDSIFSVVSIITTTGYTTFDYTILGSFASIFFFFLTYIGASAGSTAGGMKIMRISIVAKAVSQQTNRLLYPNGVFPIRYQGKPISQSLVNTVLGFCGLYVFFNVLLTLALSLIGLDFETAVSGAATSIANVGPGIGGTIGPVGNFSSLPDSAKWLLCLGMLIGRLEILTVMVIFTPTYWKF